MADYTKISPYRGGDLRFGRSSGDEPANGPVVTYRLSPEEIARRYGPPVKKHQWQRRLDKQSLAEMLTKLTVAQIADRLRITQSLVFKLVEKYGLELDEKNRLAGGGDDLAYGDKIRAARKALPKDEFLALINQGVTDQEIANAKNLDLYLVKKLKQQYGLTGLVPHWRERPRKRKERDDMTFETYPGEETIQAQVEQDDQIVKQENDRAETHDTTQAGKRMTIIQAVKFREELINEMDCVEDLLKPDADLAPRVEQLLKKHYDECNITLQQINKVFESTEIEV